MKALLAVGIAAALTLPMSEGGGRAQAWQDTKAEKGVAGQWSLSVRSPHGEVGMALDLVQEGKKVSGTLATPHGDNLPIEGEFTEGTLTLATPGTSDMRITMTAKLKDNGTLDGSLSSQMGDMTWTAKRTTSK
jgi:hypothetical protein